MSKFFLTLVLSTFLGFSTFGQIIFSEPFDEPNGSTNGIENSGAGTTWSASCPTCVGGDWFEVQGGLLEGRDTNGPASFTSGIINTSSCDQIDISFDISNTGTMENCNTGCNSGDWVQLEYRIDGGAWQAPGNSTFCAGGCANVDVIQSGGVVGINNYSSGCITPGSTLEIRISLQCWAGTEYWEIDNIAVNCISNDPGTNGNITVCVNDAPVNLFNQLGGTPDVGGSWSGPSILTNGDQGTYTPGTNTAGVYTYTVGPPGCQQTSTVTVTENPLPNVNAGPDVTICIGDNTTLTASGATNYAWDNGLGAGASHTISPGVTTTYEVTGTDANGCSNTDQVTVTANNCVTCQITNLDATIGACQVNGTYEVTGFVEFTDPPATGLLIIEDCNGNQDTYNAPFTSPQNFVFNAGAANGAACDVTAYFTADPTCTQNLPYTAPTCSCNMDQLNVNIGTCDTATNTFEINGDIEFSFPPTTGQLIIEECNGNQVSFNAPFTTPQNFTIPGITPDGANCFVTAYFTDDPGCTITSNNYTNPSNCNCPADAGTFTYTNNGSGTNNYVLCENDEYFITPNGDQVMPNDVGPLTNGSTYDPGIGFLIYSCPPTPGIDPAIDPCLEGALPANGGITDINDLVFINSFPPGTFTDNTVYFVPITLYNLNDLAYNPDCYDLGSVFNVQYLNPISETVTTDCQAGTATFTITGGYPEFNPGAQYTASNLTLNNAQFDNTTASHGGTITISGLQDGDNYIFDIVDDNGCPYTISGGPFQGVEDASFSYPDNAFCQSAVAPVPNITGVTGGTFASTPAGLDLDATSGEINLNNSTPGTYDVTYTTPNPTCFGTETVQITVIADPVVDPVADITECDQFTLAPITGTNLSGNEAYYTGTGGTGASYNPGDLISSSTTLFVYDETGTTPNCFDETSFNITINPTPSLDPIANQNECDGYTLPAIGGTNLTPGVSYYDAPNGGGTAYNPGDVISTSGTYYAYDETGTTPNCFDEVTFDVVITSSPNFTVSSNPPSSCTANDAEIVFSGLLPNTAYDVTYVDNGISVGPQSLTTDANGDIIISGLSDGSYTGFVVSINGCSGTDNSTLNIISPNNPTVGAGPDQSICEGESVTLTASNPDGAMITWDNGVNDGVAFNPGVGSMTYTVTATNAQGCTSTDEVVVTVNPLPTVDAGVDQTICEGGSVTLNGSGAHSYTWDNGIVDGIAFTPSTTATYTVTGTDANGCQNTDQVTVTVNPLPDVNFSTPVTTGCAPLSIEFNNASTGSASCVWDFGNGLAGNDCNNVTMSFTNPGCYDVTLTLTGNNGCVNELTVNDYICVDEAPVANFMYDPVRPLSTDPTVNFENLSQGATDYEWTFNEEGTSTSENPTYIFPTQAGEYPVELVAISESGCTDTAYSTVFVDEELLFYVPNTFTPDGNGKNEVFLPVMTSGFDPYDYELLIFNRWGEIVFESRNPWVGWDGTFKGQTVQNGTYVWKITFKDEYLDDLKTHTGHINLLR